MIICIRQRHEQAHLNKNGASDYKIKINIESYISRFAKWSDVDINPYLYFSVSHALFSGLLKKKMRRRFGKDWERIWKRFGDTKLNSQELEKQGEINLPKEGLKRFV